MITEAQFIDDIFVREGDAYGDEHTHPPIDQPTGRGGITLENLREYVTATGSTLPVSADTLKALTHNQARAIVTWTVRQLLRRSGLTQIDYEPLRWFMADFAYNSGPALAIRWLQRVLGVPRTGVMDPVTVAQLRFPDFTRIAFWIHQAAIGARLQMVDSAVDSHHIAKPYEDGLERRVERFSLLEVP